jgi:hypothetical protein
VSWPYHINKYPLKRHDGVDLAQMASVRMGALVKALEAVAAAKMPGEARKIAVEALRAHVGETSKP